MTAYRCRFVAPLPSDWSSIEADSPEGAASELHFRDGTRTSSPHSCTYVPNPDKPCARIFFARIEIEGHQELVSRCYSSSIGRRGGVRQPRETLEEVACAVGWERPPSELVEEGWDL